MSQKDKSDQQKVGSPEGESVQQPLPKGSTKIKNKCLLSRTLWAHDLDELLVYQKRERKQIISAVSSTTKTPHKKKHHNKPPLKKSKPELKKDKQQLKKSEKGEKLTNNKRNKKPQPIRQRSLHSPGKKQSPQKQQRRKKVNKKPKLLKEINPSQEEQILDSENEKRNVNNREFKKSKPQKAPKQKLQRKFQSNSQMKEDSDEDIDNQQEDEKSFDQDKIDDSDKKQYKNKEKNDELPSTSPTLNFVSQKLVVSSRPKRNILKKRYRRYSQDSQFSQRKKAKTIFPITNYIAPEAQPVYLEHLHMMDQTKNARKKQGQILNTKTFINCDVKYFNWPFFIDHVGSFDVILIDPPWRIKGAQQNDSEFMFSNCKFGLDYKTMSNKDIGNIGIEKLSNTGFIFMWILNTQLDASIEIMNKWGYEMVDYIVWVKLKDQKIYLTHGYYFMHSYELCIIGYKHSPDEAAYCVPKICSNTLIAEVRKKSQKPDQLYELIQLMFPNQKKIEIYARNNNLRFGWFSLGNQVGESFDKWLLVLKCDRCHTAIQEKMRRYKSKRRANYDLCQNCVEKENKEDFYEILNEVNEDIIHLYRSCDHCESNPIWGTRFECKVCPEYDMCQSTVCDIEDCFDKNLAHEPHFHPIEHDMTVVEVPPFAHGFNIHDYKCNNCFQNPIIGIRFTCKQCRNYNLCQMCFFHRGEQPNITTSKIHKKDHEMQAIFCQQTHYKDKFECFSCGKAIYEECYECKNCYKFFFCGECHQKKDSFRTQMANNHKDYHQFQKIF